DNSSVGKVETSKLLASGQVSSFFIFMVVFNTP
ncbi:unnamed protein product, partial [marine sediment metagenome]